MDKKKIFFQVMQNSKGDHFVYLNISDDANFSEVEFIKVKSAEEGIKIKNKLLEDVSEYARTCINRFET